MDPLELYRELEQKRRDLDVCIKELRKCGTAWAEAERDYQICKATTALELKDAGYSATMIQTIIKGHDDVNEAMFARDVALVTYDACKDAVNAIKLQLRLIDTQLSRELGGPSVGTGM
jgi:hypothetical protein